MGPLILICSTLVLGLSLVCSVPAPKVQPRVRPRDWRVTWCVPECYADHRQEGPCEDCPALSHAAGMMADREPDAPRTYKGSVLEENDKLRELLSETFSLMHRGGLTTGAYGRCMELFRDAQALGIEIPFMNELEAEVNE